MSQELLDNKELQELINSLNESETTMDGREQPLGKYGRMAMNYLHETNPQRFIALKMSGELVDMMYRVDEEATEKIEGITQKLLSKDPLPNTDSLDPVESIMEKTRHFNSKRSVAEEFVINEMVLISR